jgi:hypothetical protein
MKKFILITGGVLLFFVILVIVLSREEKITHLEAPILKNAKEKVGSNILISGIANPRAKLLFYVDGNYTEDTTINSDGTFQKSLTLSSEGKHSIKTKQIYREVTSEFSQEIFTEADLTPPDKKDFEITSSVPTFSKEDSFTIKGKTSQSNLIVINNTQHKVNLDGIFEVPVSLVEGKNQIEIKLSDEFNNQTNVLKSYSVVVDSTPPKISTSIWSCEKEAALNSAQEILCITTGQWESWEDPAPIPITGSITGTFSSITVNGKKIIPDENNEIYQRVYLPVPRGLNKYKVVAIDEYGNRSSVNLEMTVSSVDRNSSYDDLNDRLDDIETKIDDIEY